jgi:hypothetical protein
MRISLEITQVGENDFGVGNMRWRLLVVCSSAKAITQHQREKAGFPSEYDRFNCQAIKWRVRETFNY